MRRLCVAWFVLIFAIGGCRPKTPVVPPPLAWEVRATQTAQVRPTGTPYQQPARAAAVLTTNERPAAPFSPTTDGHYQVNTVRQTDGQPVALILRSLASQSLRDLIANSSLTPILTYYHPNIDDLLRLVIRCNQLSAEMLETEQVILIPLTQAGLAHCPFDPSLAQHYLPVQSRTALAIRDDERVLVYFTQAGETLNTLACKFKISVERLRELNGSLDAAPDNLPLQADTVVYLRLPAEYHYTPPTVVVSTPDVPRALVFTLASDQPAAAQPTAVPQVAEARPTPTPEPTTPPDTPTPEPTPTAIVSEVTPTPEAVAVETTQIHTTTVFVAANVPPNAQPSDKNDSTGANAPAKEEIPQPAQPSDHILEQYARFLNGESFSGRAALTAPLLTDGQPITLDGDAALKYLSKKNFMLGNAVRGAVRLVWRGNSLELPALGFYDIPAGARLDAEAIQRAAVTAGQDTWILTQRQFRESKDKFIQIIMGAYDQLLKDRPNLQFLILVKEDKNGKGRMIVYIYESKDQQEWTTLSGRPLNLDGCPENVQLVILAADYDLRKQTAEFYKFTSEGQ